jgi:hypothetical protein
VDPPEIPQEVKPDAICSEALRVDSAPANADVNLQSSSGLFDCKQSKLPFCAATFERRYEVEDSRHVQLSGRFIS